ncbi:M67 family metallopeptidase [Cyanobium sp. CH-040]|uniref:M67 family metallopeptidase n=1 Tax=Cyanobium sp. CH-040 TaxID=2823708 RepID=UPI0020CDBB7F|nr:M67 family metallopeptidase [Cyanobium sp. CH-040]
MLSSAPTALGADQRLRIQLSCLLRSAAPDEGCLLLLGDRRDPAGRWCLRRLWPCLNVWPAPSERHGRFAIDPREQLLAQRWGRARGLDVLGHAHSHPTGLPVPSATDLELCVRPALMLIQGQDGEQRLWWLAEEVEQPQPLPWRMED